VITPGGLTSGNYTIGYADGALTVSKAALTVTANNASKTYDGTSVANLTAGHYLLTGWASGEGATVSKTTGTYDNANAGTGKTVTVSLATGDYVPTGSTNLSNYTLPTTVSGSVGLINKAPLTATGNSASLSYNGANQSVSGFTVTGLQGRDTVGSLSSITASGASAQNAGSYTNTVTAGTETNYNVSTVNGTLNIAKAILTPIITASNKVYDTTTTAKGTVSLSGVFSVDTSAASALAHSYSFANANVGTGKAVTATGIILGSGLVDNYVLSSTTATGRADVTPAPLTVTAINDAKFVTQTDSAGYAGYAITGLLGNDTAISTGIAAGVSLARSNPTTNLAAVYNGVLQLSGSATIGNYAVSYVPGNYTIVPAGQLLVKTTSTNTLYGTASANPIASVSYLDANSNTISNLSLSSQAVVNGVTVYTYADGVSGTASFAALPTGLTTSAGGRVNVGSYGLATEQFSKTTNNLTSNTATVTGNLTVQPLAVTVAATSGTTTYNGTTQTQIITSGILNGDAVAVSGMVSQRNAGSYNSALTVSGTDARNYSVSTVNSNLTINPALLTPTFVAADKVYDGNTAASLTAIDNRFSGDVLTVSATGNFADKNVGSPKPVVVSGISLSGADARNYRVSPTGNSTSASITRLAQVSWVGGTTGSWFDPANWAGAAVPDLANVANVSIPAGVTVSFDNSPVGTAQGGQVQIDSLGTAGSLAVTSGALNVGSGGVQLNTLTQSGGALTSSGVLTVDRLIQTGGRLTGLIKVTGQPDNEAPVVAEPRLAQSQMPYRVTVVKLPAEGKSGLVHIEIKDALVDQQIALPQPLREWIADSAAVIYSDDLDAIGTPSVRLAPGGVLYVMALADALASPVILKSTTGELVLRIFRAP